MTFSFCQDLFMHFFQNSMSPVTRTQVVKEIHHLRMQNSNPLDLVRPPAEAGLPRSKIQCFVD